MKCAATHMLLSALIFLAAAGCSSGTSINDLRSQLEKNKAKWAASGIKNYSYQVTVSCFFCLNFKENNPALVTVRGGGTFTVVSMKSSKDASKYYTSYDTVEELFETMGKELDYAEEIYLQGTPHSDNDIFQLQFDPDYGIPTYYRFDAEKVLDEQIIITVNDFKTIGCSIDDYWTTRQLIETRALDFAGCSVDDDCMVYQVDLSCAADTDVAISKAKLEEFKEAALKMESDYCNLHCPAPNGSEPISVGCVDGTCQITKWGV